MFSFLFNEVFKLEIMSFVWSKSPYKFCITVLPYVKNYKYGSQMLRLCQIIIVHSYEYVMLNSANMSRHAYNWKTFHKLSSQLVLYIVRYQSKNTNINIY
jgi:hypothetical protein